MISRGVCISVAAAFLLNACGTQDYDTPPTPQPAGGQPTAPAKSGGGGGEAQAEPHRLMVKQDYYTGYAWVGLNWIGVPDRTISQLKCRLQDNPGINDFQAFGASVLGGAVLGLIIRGSGSWFFGGPEDSGPGHWFWNRVSKTLKGTTQGAVRGAVFGGACQMLLAGGSLVPFRGLLGQDFMALSTSIALGSMASIAAAPFIDKFLGQDKLNQIVAGKPALPLRDPATGRFVKRSSGPKPPGGRIESWTDASKIIAGSLLRITPQILILGVGGGVGVIVYKKLNGDDGCEVGQDCMSLCQSPPELVNDSKETSQSQLLTSRQ